MTHDLLPLGTMAARARVTQRWLRAEVAAGRIPCLNADGRLLFDPETVERILRTAGYDPADALGALPPA